MESNINPSQEENTSSPPACETSTSLSSDSTLPMPVDNLMVAYHNLFRQLFSHSQEGAEGSICTTVPPREFAPTRMKHQSETTALSLATSGSPSLASSGEPVLVLPESTNTAIRLCSLGLRDALPHISNSDWRQIQDYQDAVYRLLSKTPFTVNESCCLFSAESSAALATDAPPDQPHTVERGPGPPPQSTTSDAAQVTDAPLNQSHSVLSSQGSLPTSSSLSSFSSPSSSSASSSESSQVDDSSADHTSTGTAESSSETHLRPRGGIQFSGTRQVQEYQIHHSPQSVLPAKEHRRAVPLEREMFRQSVGRSQRSSYCRSMRRKQNKRRVEVPVESEAVSEEYYSNQEDREEDEEQGKGEEDEEGAEEEGEMEGGQEEEEEEEEEEQASKKEANEEEEEEKTIKRGNEEEGDPSDPSMDEERDQDIPEGKIVGSSDTGTHSSVPEPSLEKDGSSSQRGPDEPPRQLERVQSLSQLRPDRPSSKSDPEDPSSVLDPGEPSSRPEPSESSGQPERGETSSQSPSENPGNRKQDSDEEGSCCLKCPIHCPRIHPSRSSHTLESQGSTGSRASTSAAGSSISTQTTSPTSLEPVSQPLLHPTSRTVFDPSSIGLLMLPPSTSQTRPASGWSLNSVSAPTGFIPTSHPRGLAPSRPVIFSPPFRPLPILPPVATQPSAQSTIQFAITQPSAQPTTQSTTPSTPSTSHTSTSCTLSTESVGSTPSTQSFQSTQFTQSTAQSTQPATQRSTQVQQTTLRRSARLADRQAASDQPAWTRSASKRGGTGPEEQSSPKRKKRKHAHTHTHGKHNIPKDMKK